jgi:hypothetical protein
MQSRPMHPQIPQADRAFGPSYPTSRPTLSNEPRNDPPPATPRYTLKSGGKAGASVAEQKG